MDAAPYEERIFAVIRTLAISRKIRFVAMILQQRARNGE